jgi:hypothetical protein
VIPDLLLDLGDFPRTFFLALESWSFFFSQSVYSILLVPSVTLHHGLTLLAGSAGSLWQLRSGLSRIKIGAIREIYKLGKSLRQMITWHTGQKWAESAIPGCDPTPVLLAPGSSRKKQRVMSNRSLAVSLQTPYISIPLMSHYLQEVAIYLRQMMDWKRCVTNLFSERSSNLFSERNSNLISTRDALLVHSAHLSRVVPHRAPSMNTANRIGHSRDEMYHKLEGKVASLWAYHSHASAPQLPQPCLGMVRDNHPWQL